jgi:hypothetical protein
MMFGPLRRIGAAGLLATGLAVAALGAGRAARLDPRLQSEMNREGSQPVLAWVRFRDKGAHEAEKLASSPPLVSVRSLQRRAKVGMGRPDRTDLPLDAAYVAAVAVRVQQVRQQSKWFNAVSVLATPQQLESLRGLACVRSIEWLTRYRRAAAREETGGESPSVGGKTTTPPRRIHSLDYGRALPQVQIMNVPALHDQGLHGEGVWIGHFDNGYRLLSHEAFGRCKSSPDMTSSITIRIRPRRRKRPISSARTASRRCRRSPATPRASSSGRRSEPAMS